MTPSTLPDEPLAAAVLAFIAPLPETLINHSIRTFLFAELIAEDLGVIESDAYDRGMLFAAAALHDVGLGGLAAGRERFEVEGADLAAGLLRRHGIAAARVEDVWEAIALHTSAGIAERRGLLARLTRAGVLADLGRYPTVTPERATAIHESYPRLGAVNAIVDAVVSCAGRSPAAGAAYTLAGELARERADGGLTRLEAAADHRPWSD